MCALGVGHHMNLYLNLCARAPSLDRETGYCSGNVMPRLS
jgi:hypothetical protein